MLLQVKNVRSTKVTYETESMTFSY